MLGVLVSSVALLAGSVVSMSGVPTPTGAVATGSVATGGPVVALTHTNPPKFSTPSYLPLRKPARVSCVNKNCRTKQGSYYHNDWAIDFLGEFGDPIYAAGYGVAHIGGRESGCRDNASERRGNWVWIDHGGGESTNYYHMKNITVGEGAAVTPDDKIGEMGATGAGSPCKTPYLHFERRITDKQSRRIEPPTMWACVASRRIGYPQAFGSNTWDVPARVYTVTSQGTGCLADPARTGAPRLSSAAPTSSKQSLVATWAEPVQAPELVTAYRVAVSIWHPSTSEWSDPEYYTVRAGTRSLVVPDRTVRRLYRVRVAAKDRAGASPWSNSVDVVIADPPAKPPITQVSATKRTVTAKWKIPSNGGNKILRYDAVIMHGAEVVQQIRTSAKRRYATWSGLKAKSRYRVGVVAVNQAGKSTLSVRTVSTR